jgi:hypothetical protein
VRIVICVFPTSNDAPSITILPHMGGFFLYILVEYLIRVTGRAIKRRRSRDWPTTKATVVSATHDKSSSCDLVEVVYTYRLAGERYSGRNKKPFLFSSNAEIYVRDFSPGKEFTVRVRPDDPKVSIGP